MHVLPEPHAQLWPAGWILEKFGKQLSRHRFGGTMPFAWHMSRTYEPHPCNERVRELVLASSVVMRNEVWLHTVEWAIGAERNTMESYSNDGF